MYKLIIYVCVLLAAAPLSAKCSEVPEVIRKSYASNFYNAFLMQCQGKSVSAFAQFRAAYDEAVKSGESIQRLLVMEQLFVWYRTYGSASRLFAKTPTGWDKIHGEYERPKYPNYYQNFSKHLAYPGYSSEWGNSPEQAALIREFMLGVAETVSAVFCVTVGGPVTIGVGYGLFVDGTRRMYLSLNTAWAQNERAILDLKKWEENAKKVVDSE